MQKNESALPDTLHIEVVVHLEAVIVAGKVAGMISYGGQATRP